jgi:hypothetical protein
MGLNPGSNRPRREDIAYIVDRLEGQLIAARDPRATEGFQLHQICHTSLVTIIDIVTHRPLCEPFDVSDGLGELRDALLEVIRNEYRRILSPEPADGLIDTLTLATGGLMLRGTSGLLGPNLDAEVDSQLATLLQGDLA